MKTFKYKNETWTVENNIIRDPNGVEIYVNPDEQYIQTQKRKTHALWNGYLFIYCGVQRIRQHILLAAFYLVSDDKYVGGLNMDDFVVHHINHKKTDNSIKNLVILTKEEHDWLHGQLKTTNKKQSDLLAEIFEHRCKK